MPAREPEEPECSFEDVLSHEIVLEGKLRKRFARRPNRWNERHFVLRGRHVLYYTKRPTTPAEAKGPRGVFSLKVEKMECVA